MPYKCKRSGCTKTSMHRDGPSCSRCDSPEARRDSFGSDMVIAPSFESDSSSSSDLGSRYSGGGGDFGGGGASGSWD
jgi:uncharacterized membrane protein YgcG